MYSGQFTSVSASHRLSQYAASAALPRTHRRGTEGRNRHDAADVRVFLPGDGRLQRRQAGDAVAVHQLAWRRQPSLRPARCRPDHGVRHPGLHQRHATAATPLGVCGDAGGDGGAARRVLAALPDRAAVGVGRVLSLGCAGRQPPHQPVLVARQRHFRRPAGQAALRLRRRRRQPWRHRRIGLCGDLRPRDRHQQPAPRRRRHARVVLRRRLGDRRPREIRRSRRERRRRQGDEPARSDRPAAIVEALPGDRARHQLCRHWRWNHRAAAQHGRRGCDPGQGCANGPAGQRHLLLVDGRVHHPDDADVAAPPAARDRLRSALDARHDWRHGGADAVDSCALDLHHRPRARYRAALHRRQDHARDPVRAAANEHEVQGKAVCRRGGRPLRQGRGRGSGAHHRHQDLPSRVVAAELSEPRRLSSLDLHGAACAARVPRARSVRASSPARCKRASCA